VNTRLRSLIDRIDVVPQVWRVEFAAPVPAGVVRKSMVQIDTISNAGTVLRNNTCEDAASSRSRPTLCLDPRCCCR